MPDPPVLLKEMVDLHAVTVIARAVGAESDLDERAFLKDVFDSSWDDLALKERVRHIASTLRSHLPEPYPAALGVLVAALPAVDEAGMAAWSLCDFVEVYGLEDPDVSLPALEEFTKVISAEFAVRPFLIRDPDRMIAQHLEWAHHSDPAVRRLATEGIRPRLPWGTALRSFQKDPTPIIPIVSLLRHDPSEDVRRSVANNLNDISKDHPDLVVQLLSDWQDGTPEVSALIRHALRTLLKKGHAGAMLLLGFSPDISLELAELSVEPSMVLIGGFTTLRCVLTSTEHRSQALMIDYAVEYQNVSGTGSRKVFKGLTTVSNSGETIELRRKISLAQRTTRRILPGPHRVEILANGNRVGSTEFEVATG